MAWESYRERINGGLNMRYFVTAVPSATTEEGPFSVGDEFVNVAPTAGGTHKWICTTAGATGAAATFKPVAIGA
jgi:hypothetical protein